MIDKERCSYARIGGESFENCKVVNDSAQVDNNSAEVDNGSWWGWLVCAITCSNYTEAFNYSYYTDKCTCEGKWTSPMWRR